MDYEEHLKAYQEAATEFYLAYWHRMRDAGFTDDQIREHVKGIIEQHQQESTPAGP